MRKEEKLLLLGGGGHCLSVLDTLARIGWNPNRIGIVDGGRALGTFSMGIAVVGNDDDLPNLFALGYKNAFLAFAGVETTSIRQRLYADLKQIGFVLPTLVDPDATVSTHAKVGEGVFIGKRAVVNALAQIAACAIINTGAIVEHECSVGSFAHIAPGAVLCGNVTVGQGTMVGAGSCVRQGLTLAPDLMIGAGSVVVKPLVGTGGTVFVGNPCTPLKSR